MQTDVLREQNCPRTTRSNSVFFMDVPSKKEKSLEEAVRLNSTERHDLSGLHGEQNKGKGI